MRLNVHETLDALAAAGKKADPEVKQSLLEGLKKFQRAATPIPSRIFLPRWATIGASTIRRARAGW